MKVFLTILLSMFVLTNTVIAQPVNICDDDAGWAPYVYFPMIAGKPDRTKVVGATADLIREVFRIMKMDYTIELLPWARCLLEVHNFGESKKYEMFADGTYTDERAAKYYITTPIYKTHMGAFYSTKKFPDGVSINKPQDLNKFRLCGIRGYNYSPYIEAGVKEEIYQGAGTTKAAIGMVAIGRYDFFLSSVEPVYGSHATGELTIPKYVKHVIVPDTKKYIFRLFVAKTSPRAYELYTKVNQAIIILQGRGEASKIFKKYLPGGDGL